ncbi:transcriptional repressor DicA [compost metagenome]
MSVGTRLKEERKRLGHTQEAMALACGVGKRSQILFEQDAHLPGGAYFAEADALGVDTVYVLVGRRERLSPEDAELIDMWRAAKPAARAAAIATLSGNTAHSSAAAPAPRTQFNDATIGQQISGDVDLTGQKLVVKPAATKKKPAR